MKPVLERLKAGEILISDGALGTQLIERGLGQGACPESWNLTRPEVIAEVARLYLDAGADLVTTNTFGASPVKLSCYGLSEKTGEINAEGVRIVREAVGDRAFIMGSFGPSGQLLKPFGDAEPEVLRQSYERQLKALVEAGVDVLCLETMTDLQEAAIAVKAARALSSQIPVIATMTFDRTPRGFFTIMGTSIEKACKGLAEAGADVVGSNCGNGIEAMVEIAREFKKHTALPVIIQANAGLPQVRGGRTTYPETPELFGEKTRDLLAAGVSIVGGCCGTSPDHIRAIKRTVASMRR